MEKTGSAPTPKAIYGAPNRVLHSPGLLLHTLVTPLPMWCPMMPRLATVLYSPTRTQCRPSSQHLESFSYRDSSATSANKLRPCLSTINVLKMKMKTKIHLVKIVTGTKSIKLQSIWRSIVKIQNQSWITSPPCHQILRASEGYSTTGEARLSM
jgi:hypothetical protein